MHLNHDAAASRLDTTAPADDDVISMGGTLGRLVDQGHEVHVAYQTSGNIAGTRMMRRVGAQMHAIAQQTSADTAGRRGLRPPAVGCRRTHWLLRQTRNASDLRVWRQSGGAEAAFCTPAHAVWALQPGRHTCALMAARV